MMSAGLNIRTWAEIDRNALAHNMREIRKVTMPNATIMAVVKANGYGHGASETARVALANGANQLGVAVLEEGIALRQSGIKVPILILGSSFSEQSQDIIRYNLMPTLCNWETAIAISREARRAGESVKVYIKLETGMNRIGIVPEEAVSFVKRIVNLDGVLLEGVFTHFSMADQRDKSYTKMQHMAFNKVSRNLEAEGVCIPNRSAANSAAIIDLPETHLDFVRGGIIMYGIYPSTEVQRKIAAQPALQFKTRVIHLKFLPKGNTVSYGNTYTTRSDTCIATLPVGYADGYNRSLSNHGQVLIRGKRYSIAGTICMDQCMVDIGLESRITLGDEVVLIGTQGEECISADEIAGLVGTIPYEIICGISARAPRIYVGEGK